MSTHGKSAINSSDRTRTDVKSDNKVNKVISTEKIQTSRNHNNTIQDNQVVKQNNQKKN